jgi:L-ribulose-5-phosphate 3-epimerase UlaE
MSLASTIESALTTISTDIGNVAASSTPILGEIKSGLDAVTALAKLFDDWKMVNNSPAMQNASDAQKLLNFKARIDQDLNNGAIGEADLEKLESGGSTP